MRIRVFGPENYREQRISNLLHIQKTPPQRKLHTRPNLINLLKVRRNTSLFRQLRTLRKERCPPEIIHLEHARPTLCRGGLQLCRMDLEESTVVEVGTSIFAHKGLDTKY